MKGKREKNMEASKDLTLLIMAAGMGSRFGGLKQIEPIGPTGEFITDYSIYDALLAGVKKVVFIIKRENLEVFQETIEKRIAGRVEVEYAFQDKTIEYDGEILTREKPWGTAHAILSAKDKINGNFLVINSDDFYGREAYLEAVKFYEQPRKESEFALVGYKVVNTLTENGSVKRGVCKVANDHLKTIVESKVERIENKIVATPLSGKPSFEVQEDTLVSMNMFLFTPYIFKLIEENLNDFLEQNRNNMETAEYLIPDLVQKCIEEGKISLEVLNTSAKWEGVTYKEDKESVVRAIQKQVQEGVYQENLWQK